MKEISLLFYEKGHMELFLWRKKWSKKRPLDPILFPLVAQFLPKKLIVSRFIYHFFGLNKLLFKNLPLWHKRQLIRLTQCSNFTAWSKLVHSTWDFPKKNLLSSPGFEPTTFWLLAKTHAEADRSKARHLRKNERLSDHGFVSPLGTNFFWGNNL